MVIGTLVAFGLLVVIFNEFFGEKPSKTPEQELGEALTKYLSAGVKIRKEVDEKK